MKIGDQVFRAVLETGATLSVVARRPLKTFKKTKTVAIRVGDGRTIHSLGGVDVTICLGDETVTQHCRVLDTDAFDIFIGTDFLRRNPQVKMLSLQRPYFLHCDFGSGLAHANCTPFFSPKHLDFVTEKIVFFAILKITFFKPSQKKHFSSVLTIFCCF